MQGEVGTYVLGNGEGWSQKTVAETCAERMSALRLSFGRSHFPKGKPKPPQRPEVEGRGKQIKLRPYIGESP